MIHLGSKYYRNVYQLRISRLKLILYKHCRPHQVVLIQFTDFLLGVVSAKMNNATKSKTKLEVIAHLEQELHHKLKSTFQSEEKFNIFKIRLEGGVVNVEAGPDSVRYACGLQAAL